MSGPAGPRPHWRDRVLLVAATLTAVLFVLVQVPEAGGSLPLRYGGPLVELLLVLLSLGCAVAAGRSGTGVWRRFWGFWAAAAVIFVVTRLLAMFPPTGPMLRPVLRDVLFLSLYGVIWASLDTVARAAATTPASQFGLRVWRATSVLYALTLVVFFRLLPLVVSPEVFRSTGSTGLMYAMLDLYLTAWIAALWLRVSTPAWRGVFLWLALMLVVWTGLDLVGSIAPLIGYRLSEPASRFLTSLGLLPTLFFIVASRYRPPTADAGLVVEGDPGVAGHGALIILLLVAPVVHFGLYWLGWLDPATRPYREVWVLVVVIGFAAMVFWYQAGLERIVREAALARARAETQLARTERLEMVGRLSAGVAHDFNNLLTVILGGADLLQRPSRLSQADIVEEAEEIARAGARGAAMVRRLLSFGSSREIAMGAVDLPRLVRNLLPTLRRLIPAHIEIRFQPPEGRGVVQGDPTAIEEILINLATNARDAMRDGGVLELSIAPAPRDPASPGSDEWVCFRVRDTGTGLSEEALAHLFEPYYTTKPKGQGTGLGLAMVYGLTRQMGGEVAVVSDPGRGTEVRIMLASATDVGPAVGVSTPPASPAAEGATILLVEDDPAVRRTNERVLRSAGYEVLAAPDGLVGLDLLRARGAEISLVVSDVTMPRMGGLEFYRQSREFSAVPFLFVSGYTPERPLVESGRRLPFLPKPYTNQGLLAAARDAMRPVAPVD